jgi:hypothetical protein
MASSKSLDHDAEQVRLGNLDGLAALARHIHHGPVPSSPDSIGMGHLKSSSPAPVLTEAIRRLRVIKGVSVENCVVAFISWGVIRKGSPVSATFVRRVAIGFGKEGDRAKIEAGVPDAISGKPQDGLSPGAERALARIARVREGDQNDLRGPGKLRNFTLTDLRMLVPEPGVDPFKKEEIEKLIAAAKTKVETVESFVEWRLSPYKVRMAEILLSQWKKLKKPDQKSPYLLYFAASPACERIWTTLGYDGIKPIELRRWFFRLIELMRIAKMLPEAMQNPHADTQYMVIWQKARNARRTTPKSAPAPRCPPEIMSYESMENCYLTDENGKAKPQ